MTPDEKFLERLDKAIVFRSRSEDPHGVANAVLCSLFEVRNAYAESRGLPRAGELITPAEQATGDKRQETAAHED